MDEVYAANVRTIGWLFLLFYDFRCLKRKKQALLPAFLIEN
jgi:hypothetical protein